MSNLFEDQKGGPDLRSNQRLPKDPIWKRLIFGIGLFIQHSLLFGGPCSLDIHQARVEVRSYLNIHIDSVATLEKRWLKFSADSCLSEADSISLVAYINLCQDFAYFRYQRAEYDKAAQWSSEAVMILELVEVQNPNWRENIIIEHCFYSFWNNDREEIERWLLQVPSGKAKFIEGLQRWRPDGKQWQEADSLMQMAHVEMLHLS